MNAPKRHQRGHGTLHTASKNAQPKSTGDTAPSVKIGATKPMFDNWGSALRKKDYRSGIRKNWRS